MPQNDSRQSQLQLNSQHPWHGLAHADHQNDELEPLVRTLRYALIDLQKFWVQVQSIPVFMNGLKACSLDEIEKIFQWILTSPPWNERISHPRLVAELAQGPTRKLIQEFAKSVLCVRSIREEIRSKLGAIPADTAGLEKLWGLLSEAQQIIQRHEARDILLADVDQRIHAISRDWEQVRIVQRFFGIVTEETGAPLPADAAEGLRVIKALECIQRMPDRIRPWRTRHVLDSAQRIRLQAWRDRAKPTIEMRKRLETIFNLEAAVTLSELRHTAEALKQDGILSQFKAPYRQALEKYRSLLRDKAAIKADGKLTGFQKAERLLEWVGLIEQTRAYLQHAEARQAFAPHFRGIDTAFQTALEANAWAQGLRDELFHEGSEARMLAFDSVILEFITQIPDERILAACALIESPEAADVRKILEGSLFGEDPVFARMESRRKKQYWDLRRLKEIAAQIKLASEVPFAAISEISERVEEAFFLIRRMESDEKLKTALKEAYAGVHTDLSLIEPCAAYVKAVKTAGLPEELEASLLSAYGPQRLDDARTLVSRCLNSMALVREHYRRLEVATREQIRIFAHGGNLEAAPLLELMDRIQAALKSAQRLGEAVCELQGRRDSQSTGLKVDRDSSESAVPQTL